ncbi:hypothetical protein Tco_0111132 [Tanacetum coccineum]
MCVPTHGSVSERVIDADAVFSLESTRYELGVGSLLLPFEQSATKSEEKQHPFFLDCDSYSFWKNDLYHLQFVTPYLSTIIPIAYRLSLVGSCDDFVDLPIGVDDLPIENESGIAFDHSAFHLMLLLCIIKSAYGPIHNGVVRLSFQFGLGGYLRLGGGAVGEEGVDGGERDSPP